MGEAWLPRLRSRTYDPRDVPLDEKAGALVGMSMTEKQGGSDVRSNTTIATPVYGPGGAGHGAEQYTLVGHKWFTSAPMSDGFLTLAHVAGSNTGKPSCFLVPRWLPGDGGRNSGLRVMRLKDKLGEGFKGILYGGYMLTPDRGVMLIEFNCRFGDPECLNLLSLLEPSTDFAAVCAAMANGGLKEVPVAFQKLGAMGLSVLFASGDQGVLGREGRGTTYHPDFPASSPYITAVGGTDFATDSIGEEAVWPSGGGGFSDHFPYANPRTNPLVLARAESRALTQVTPRAWQHPRVPTRRGRQLQGEFRRRRPSPGCPALQRHGPRVPRCRRAGR